MKGPCIKGIVIADVAANLRRLVEKGRIAPEQLEVRLEAEDLALLEAKVQPALWYSIYSFERLMQVMADAEAGDDREGYLRRKGRITAERIQELGLYAQLERSDDGADGSPDTLSERAIKLTLSLWPAMVNFSRCRLQMESDDPLVFRVDVDDAEHFVPVLRVANAGFLEGVFSHLADAPVRVEIDEDEDAHFVYRIQLERG
jgi:hypothetical protein